MTEREIAETNLLSWICGRLAHAVGGHWVRRGMDGVYVCLCGGVETNRVRDFYRPIYGEYASYRQTYGCRR